MANTTFNGPVRSENGFTVISKNSTTGTVTTEFTLDGNGLQVTPVALADTTAISLTATAHGGRTSVVPALTATCTLTLPSPGAIKKAWMLLPLLTSHKTWGRKAPLYFGDIQWLMQ